MTKPNTIKELIESLAIRHVDIKHNPEGDKHFISSDDESDTSEDTILYYPAVLLTNVKKKISGINAGYSMNSGYLLSVVEHVEDTGDYAAVGISLANTERILLELLNELVLLKRNYKELLGGFTLDGIEIVPIENRAVSQFGNMAEIIFSAPYRASNCTSVFIPESEI